MVVIFSFIPVIAILFLYAKVYKKVEEKEGKGKAELDDYGLLILIGVSAIHFILISFALIFSEIFK